MTFASDKKAVNEQSSQKRLIDEFDSDNVELKKMILKKVAPSLVRRFIASFHYSKTMPDSSRFAYIGYLDESIAGIVVFGMGSNPAQYTSLIPDIKNGEYIELTRLWSPDGMPKNTESMLISKALDALPKEIRLVVSYADPSQGHIGTIYQATNWLYCGMSSGGKMLQDKDGKIRHAKSINIYRIRHPELRDKLTEEIMKLYGWRWVSSSGKHRYVFLRGNRRDIRKMKKKLIIHPYPRREKNQGDSP